MDGNNLTINGFFDELNNKQISGLKCTNCGKIHFPSRAICDKCNSQNFEKVEIKGEATLEAFSVVYVPTSKMVAAGYGRENPNCVGIVKLSEGPMISAEIIGLDSSHPERIKIGSPLKAKFLERGEKFVLAFEA